MYVKEKLCCTGHSMRRCEIVLVTPNEALNRDADGVQTYIKPLV
jgi:hypothetical protein